MSSARISRSADPHPKILDLHRKKLAVIYVRQSSLYQVENHLESQKRQYQLTERAELLGWPTARCVVIDEDLGISGAQSFNRPGYQRLVSMVALREVGIVFGLEISRLARNSLDWYQLLELAAAFDVLIADEDGVYNPAEFNDRLLLGLKGTISEVELYQIKPEWCAGASIRHNVIRRDCRPVCQVNCHDPRRASATALCHIRLMEGEEQIPEMSLMPLRQWCSV